MTEKNYIIDTMAASGMGDLWLSADGAAIALGMITPAGLPNRRRFLEELSLIPGFPTGIKIGREKKWRKSDLMAWAEEQVRINRAA